MIRLLLLLMVLAGWTAHTNDRAFAPTPAAPPWAEIINTNYRAACVDYKEPSHRGERAVPGLDQLDRWGDSTTYTASTADGRVFLVPCRVAPPTGTPGS